MSTDYLPRLGWIGLGSMGLGMAKNLQAHLKQLPGARPLCFTNRTMSRGKSLEAINGRPCENTASVVQQSDIVFVSTSDDGVLKTIVKDIIESGDIRGKIIVETTTIHPKTSSEINELLTVAGAAYVAVFGASPLAESGQLLFVLGGDDSAIEAILPYIKGVMGRDVARVGTDPSKALLMKATGNFITAGLMEVISEAHVFAEKTGLGSELLEGLIEQNWGGIMHAMSSRVTSGAYLPPKGQRPRSDLMLAIKDVGHGVTMAQDAGTRLEVGEVIMDHYQAAETWSEEHGGRQLDSSSMYGVIRQRAGLDFESDVVKAYPDE